MNYKPKNGQDPEMFNAMYMDYISKLNSDSNSTSDSPAMVSERPYSQQSSAASEQQSKYEDRQEGDQEDDGNHRNQ